MSCKRVPSNLSYFWIYIRFIPSWFKLKLWMRRIEWTRFKYSRTSIQLAMECIYIHQIVLEFVSKLVEFDRVSNNSDSLHSATWYTTYTIIKTKSTINKRTSFLLYHGLHSWTVFSPSFFNVYLVAVTGILPSVSPLVTNRSNKFSNQKKIQAEGEMNHDQESYHGEIYT